MIIDSPRSRERRIGRKAISTIMENKSTVLAIHYSCESFKLSRSSTPRITSISVYNIATRGIDTFSLHVEAERKGYDVSQLSREELDAAERSMLQKFYGFAKKHQYYVWVHWCMKNPTYGFEALENRFAILTKRTAPKLRAQNRFDLSSLLKDLYGSTYESSEYGGKLYATLRRNKFYSGGILSGEQEANAFRERNYQAIMRSNHDKAEAIGLVTEAAGQNKLKTAASVIEIYGLSVLGVVLYVGDNLSKIKKITSGVSGFFGIMLLWDTEYFIKLYKYVFKYLTL